MKRFEIMKKNYASKALLKMGGGGMHPPHSPWIRLCKCPLFRHCEQWKRVISFFHENFWEVLAQTTASGRDDFFLFLVLTSFGTENWTSAGEITLKEPVLLLRGENMVTLLRTVESQ